MLVSTTHGGHVHTISPQASGDRRRRRLHSDEFKADAVASAARPGVSMASVAMSLGINANLLRRWVRDAEVSPVNSAEGSAPPLLHSPELKSSLSSFVPVQLPAPVTPASDIRMEVKRGSTTVVVTWPAALATECGTWLRELLR
ncbi:transposase [Variovorax sp. J22R133]|uniref:transposase n=1 Tax=Variovorax brevis TaxID=3053503 RepID=UPI0025777CDA|nr:transposase [Variovorax sp. J22R133]MDM0117539.1 transposase [Variovorax sp. J22R133]